MNQKVPNSAYDQVGGMVYFSRLLSKIRLFSEGELPMEYHANLGNGADAWCANFLRVSYENLRARVLAGGTDEEILEWCFQSGRRLNPDDLLVWNSFATKLGIDDLATSTLDRCKADAGLAHRDDLRTMFEFFDVDEGRKP